MRRGRGFHFRRALLSPSNQVATPTFSPAAGAYGPSQSVTIACATAGASIYYTVDGSTPTTGSTAYTGAITVSSTQTVQALAVKSGMTDSAIGSAAYTINGAVATPTFSPAAGSYGSTQSVTISCATAGASIYYTTDGSTPTTSSTPYTGAVSVASSLTLKALAVKSGYSDSSVGSAAYTIGASAASQPTAGLAAGTYDRAMTQAITLSTSSAGASIYYTTDGSTPTTGSTLYTGAIAVDATTTIKALASGGGFTDSTVFSGTYTIIAPQLYVPGNGFNTGTSIVDASGYARAITVAGNAQFSTAQSKFNGSSVALDGTGDYFESASLAAFGCGTGNFIHCGWVRATSTQVNGTPAIASDGTAWGANAWALCAAHTSNSNKVTLYNYNIDTANPIIATTLDIRDSAWHFWMLVRNGTSIKLFIDGSLQGTKVSSASWDGGGAKVVRYGHDFYSGDYLTGYESHCALYVGSTLTDTEALAWYNANVAFAPHPNLLLHMDGTNGSTTFTDSSNSALTVTANGNMQVSTTNPNFGTGCGLLDGAGDYGSLGGQSAFAIGSADFTAEGWINSSSLSAIQTLLDMRPLSTDGAYPTFYVDATTGYLQYLVSSANRITGTTSVGTGAYVHVAICRSAGVTRMFLAGVQQGSNYSDSNVYLNGASRPAIGGNGFVPSNYSVNGRLDEWQVINGYAKYTANFTPPTRAFVA